MDTYEYNLTNRKSWGKEKGTKVFENHGDYHSYYITLFNDSTFSLFAASEGMPWFISFGIWKDLGNKILLNWDCLKTINSARNESVTKQYCSCSELVAINV